MSNSTCIIHAGSRHQGWLARAVCAGFGVAAAWLMLEAGLWVAHAMYRAHTWRAVSTDSAKLTIACAGDSFTAGIGAPTGQDYPQQLERLLNAQYPGKVRVVNWGMAGRNSAQICAALPALMEQIKPAIVLLLFGGANNWNRYGYASASRLPRWLHQMCYRSRVIKLGILLCENVADRRRQRAASAPVPEAPRTAHPEDYYRTALLHYRRGTYEHALAWCRAGIAEVPHDPQNYLLAAYLLHEVYRSEEALRVLAAGADANPQHAELAFRAGLLALQSTGGYAAARGWFERAAQAAGGVTATVSSVTYFTAHDVPDEEERARWNALAYELHNKDDEAARAWLRGDLFRAITLCQSHGAHVILLDYPLRPRPLQHVHHARGVNTVIHEMARAAGVRLVSNSVNFSALGQAADALFSVDAMDAHPNARGYALMAQAAAQCVTPLLADAIRQRSGEHKEHVAAWLPGTWQRVSDLPGGGRDAVLITYYQDRQWEALITYRASNVGAVSLRAHGVWEAVSDGIQHRITESSRPDIVPTGHIFVSRILHASDTELWVEDAHGRTGYATRITMEAHP